MRGLGNAARIGASLLGKHSAGWQIDRAANVITGRFKGMSPEWHREHEQAFQVAQNEAKGHFHRCPKCSKWVCEVDWNEQEGLCVKDAPRMNVEVASARSSKMVKDIQEKAGQTRVFDGEIESKQTICPNCGKPSGTGKFCNNCGSNLALLECERCGTKSPADSRFWGEWFVFGTLGGHGAGSSMVFGLRVLPTEWRRCGQGDSTATAAAGRASGAGGGRARRSGTG